MGAILETSTVADPDKMGRRVIHIPGRGIHAGKRFFVREQQCFMTGVIMNPPKLGRVGGIDA